MTSNPSWKHLFLLPCNTVRFHETAKLTCMLHPSFLLCEDNKYKLQNKMDKGEAERGDGGLGNEYPNQTTFYIT